MKLSSLQAIGYWYILGRDSLKPSFWYLSNAFVFDIFGLFRIENEMVINLSSADRLVFQTRFGATGGEFEWYSIRKGLFRILLILVIKKHEKLKYKTYIKILK